jgi:AraC family transcriptional regulator
VEHVVERVLAAVRGRLGRQYTIDDLARIAMFSKYHFARMFRDVTGMPPRRFLYALRLEEAKNLLVTTSLNVADISHRVGYSSVGTFTSRFTASVGVTPAVYRRLRGNVASMLCSDPPDAGAHGVIAVRLQTLDREALSGQVVLSLFERPVPEGLPFRCQIVNGAREWSFRCVPMGQWYVLAVSSPGGDDRAVTDHPRMLISASEPVRLRPEAPAARVIIRLRPMRPVDPPLLSPLPGLPKRLRPTPADRLRSVRADQRRVPADREPALCVD